MPYRTTNSRCAIILKNLEPIPEETIITILQKRGLEIIDIDIISIARKCIGESKYLRGAKLSQAPNFFDCSSFVKWLYSYKGVWLPRRSIQQRQLGEVVEINQLTAGDVVFSSGRINYYLEDQTDSVGHEGIYTGQGTIIHAANAKSGIIESPIEKFIGKNFRGARRYFPKDKKAITCQIPAELEIEGDDDIKWIILQSLYN